MNCRTKWVLADSNPNDSQQFGTKGCQTPTEVSPCLMATTWFPSQDREISVGSGLTLEYWSDHTSAMYKTTCHIVQRYKKVTKFSPKNKMDLQMACYAPPLEKAKKQPYPSSVPPHLNKCMLVKNFAWEEKKDDKIGLASQLPHTLGYVHEYICELPGSIILSACWVWFGVCSFFGHYPGNT